MMRLRFIEKKTPNAEHRTPNIECRELSVGRWALGVERFPWLSLVKALNNNTGISRDDSVCRHAFRDNGSRSHHRVFADRDAFQNHCVHPDPDIVANLHGRGFQFRARRTIFVERCERLGIDEALGRFERMKIRIRDPHVPRNQTARADIDLLLGHDQRAIEQCEIADRALTAWANCERAAGITRDMFSDHHGARLFALQLAKDLR
jgi:hypothetical protein